MALNANPRDVVEYFKAGYSAIVLNTVEEVRTLKNLQQIANDEDAHLWVCSVTEGMLRMGKAGSNGDQGQASVERVEANDATEIIDAIMGRKGKKKEWFALLDFDDWIEGQPFMLRKMRDMIHRLGATTRRVIFIQAGWKIPLKLEREVTIMDLGLPDADELEGVLNRTVSTYRETYETATKEGRDVKPMTFPSGPEESERLVEAAKGLTTLEAENAYSLSFQRKRCLDHGIVSEEKLQIVRKGGLIEIIPTQFDLGRVGGHDVLKAELALKRRAFDKEARTYGLDQPNGYLLTGHQGTGKSLIAKCIALSWGFLLVRVDLGSIHGGILGESEANMKRVISILDKLGRVVVWMDEIDKALAQPKGAIAGGGEAGKHVLGIFLTWLQEKQTPTFVLATANEVDQLPAELLRAGRFDRVWFSGMPTPEEREEIMGILIRQKGREPAKYGLDRIAYESDGFTGAELEGCRNKAMNVAFNAGRDFNTTDIVDAIHGFIPGSKTMAHVFNEREEWAKTRATATSSKAKIAGQMGTAPRSVEV